MFVISNIEVEKMAEEKDIQDKVYEAIERAKATGKIKKGTNEVTKAIERGEAKLVASAKDASPPEITMHIPLLSEEKGIHYGRYCPHQPHQHHPENASDPGGLHRALRRTRYLRGPRRHRKVLRDRISR